MGFPDVFQREMLNTLLSSQPLKHPINLEQNLALCTNLIHFIPKIILVAATLNMFFKPSRNNVITKLLQTFRFSQRLCKGCQSASLKINCSVCQQGKVFTPACKNYCQSSEQASEEGREGVTGHTTKDNAVLRQASRGRYLHNKRDIRPDTSQQNVQ